MVAVTYLPALQGGFVCDDVTFAEEPVIHSPGGLRSIWLPHYWPWSTPASGLSTGCGNI